MSEKIAIVTDCGATNVRSVRESSVTIDIDFLNEKGGINGLGMNVQRTEIYRAILVACPNKPG